MGKFPVSDRYSEPQVRISIMENDSHSKRKTKFCATSANQQREARAKPVPYRVALHA